MQEKPDQPNEIRHYRSLAKKIIRSHFGEPASRIVYRPSGRTNFVFSVNHVEGQFVVRISPDRERLAEFRKELWATEKVRKAGVPSPEVLAVGNDVIAEPYMISHRVTGTEASHHPKRQRIVQQMGEYAAIINSIHTESFGANFDWTDSGDKYLTWEDYLHGEFRLDERLEFFAAEKIKAFNIINYYGALRQAVEQDDHKSLAEFKLRLRGCLDLYSLPRAE